MSPERRLAKTTRAKIRELKAEERREVGLTHLAKDSHGAGRLEEFLRLKLGPAWREKYSPYFPLFNEFRKLREEIKMSGYKKELIDAFQEKHGQEKLSELTPVLRLVIEYVGK